MCGKAMPPDFTGKMHFVKGKAICPKCYEDLNGGKTEVKEEPTKVETKKEETKPAEQPKEQPKPEEKKEEEEENFF